MTVLELRDVRKDFTDAHIDVSLRAESGEQLVLLGPSGCGKTTVLRMIAGLTEHDGGEILFDGQSMAGVAPENRNAAMVFQAHALFPFRTVFENVEYGLKIRKVPSDERVERTQAALDAVQLGSFADRWPDDLSGGERQRVALARAIVVEPRVLLLDEPLSSLDPVLRSDLQQLVCSVQRDRQMTSVFVTHDREEAVAVADKIAVMLDGRVKQVGSPTEVFAQPASDAVAQFLGQTGLGSTGPGSAKMPVPNQIGSS